MKHNHSNRNYLDAQANGRLSVSDQLREIHANALPGVTRPEEGESTLRSPTPGNVPMSNGYSHPAYQSYEERERQQSYNRYEDYLDERDNELLPNAFDLGWKRNLGHVFGPSPLLWFIPICNTTGDGWSWEPSPKWLAVRERIKRDRETEEQEQKQRERAAGWGLDSPTEAEFRRSGRIQEGWQPARHNVVSPRHPRRPEWQSPLRHGEPARYLTTSNGIVNAPKEGRRSLCKADQILGRASGMYTDGDVPLQTLDKKKFDQYNYISEDEDEDDYEVSSDEQAVDQKMPLPQQTRTVQITTQNWNDIPEGFLNPAPKGKKSASREQNSSPKKAQEWDDWGS